MTLFGELPFDDTLPKPPPEQEHHSGPVAAVAIEDSVDKLLDYAIPPGLRAEILVGQRVRVPLGRGNRAAFGYIMEVKPASDYPRIKKILAIDDPRPLVTGRLLDLARWMSRYYCAPLGTVIDCILPSAVKNRVGMEYLQMVRLARPRDEVQRIFEQIRGGKRKAILAHLLQLEPDQSIELSRLANEVGTTPPTVRKLVRLGLISLTSEPDMTWADAPAEGQPAEAGQPPAPHAPPALNEDQQAVFIDLEPCLAAGGFSVNLLFGVTGSGKTEIYLRCIERIVAQGRQAIVMVPEIALTPQTVRRFTARFARVAVLHSGLSATQRHRFWQQCATGSADVVVGARSAVFAPLANLGIIVVDEEHEPSYKQDQAPRYHGRDVAIMRAKLHGIPILLGSATPSLESYYRAAIVPKLVSAANQATAAASTTADTHPPQDTPPASLAPQPPPSPPRPAPSSAADPAQYRFLTLPRRVRGLQLPEIDIVDMKEDSRNRPRGHIHLFSRRLENMLKQTVEQGHQAILLLNRRGYSSFVYCSSCQEPIHCQYCDTTMTYHRTVGSATHDGTFDHALHSGQMLCHYCLAVAPLPSNCPTCGKKLSLFGLGTQRVEEELTRKFPEIRYARVDSDAMHSARDYEELLGRFGRGEIQVMLGTQMIAKGLDYPNVTLVGVINGDTALQLPDFRSAERTFQLITQVAGRAGRGDAPGRVVLQSFMPDDPTIQAAIRQDYVGFATTELQHRRAVNLPPYHRMVRIVVRDQDQDKLHKKSQELAEQVARAIAEITAGSAHHSTLPLAAPTPVPRLAVVLKGPMPCPISRISGYFRDQILLASPRADHLQQVLNHLRQAGHLATSDRIAVDVDPVSVL